MVKIWGYGAKAWYPNELQSTPIKPLDVFGSNDNKNELFLKFKKPTPKLT